MTTALLILARNTEGLITALYARGFYSTWKPVEIALHEGRTQSVELPPIAVVCVASATFSASRIIGALSAGIIIKAITHSPSFERCIKEMRRISIQRSRRIRRADSTSEACKTFRGAIQETEPPRRIRKQSHGSSV